MAILFLDDVKILLDKHEPPCASVFIPTLRGATEANQNLVRFKNLLRRLEEELSGRGMRKPQVDKFLERPRLMLSDPIYWHQQSDGFAMFLSPQFFKAFRVGRRMPEVLVVGERFYTKPLLPLVFENGRFYILAVSQKGVRFFQGARDGANEIEIPNLLQGVNEILRQYVGERHVEFHTSAGRQTGARQAYPAYHGQGGGSLNSDDKILEYLYQVDKCLRHYLQNEHAPLVFAGVEYLFPMYKEANTYQYLVDEPVTGNPDRLSAIELHQKALQIVANRLEQKKQLMLDKYRQFAGTGHTSANAKEVVLKAVHGRVDTLFLAEGAQLRGRFDPTNQAIELHDGKQADGEDLLDLAANQTFLSGGVVYELAPDRMPDDSPVAAILRY
jgi:hypothetical protein